MGKTLGGILIGIFMATFAVYADTNSSPSTDDAGWQRHVTETYQALQAQQIATQRAIEDGRQEADVASKRAAETLDARLRQIEQGLNSQRKQEVDALQNSHRFTLILVGAIAGAGFLGMLLIVVFLIRAMNRRAPLSAVMPENALALAPLDPVREGTARLRANMARLEDRLDQLETTTQETETEPVPEVAGRVALLLGKGQALMNLQRVEAALECFEEAISIDSSNAEALVKKGAALEKLGRLDESIESYDLAIGVDTGLTMAYLCKGGVFNRMERYGEALQCYEQALRAQQKS